MINMKRNLIIGSIGSLLLFYSCFAFGQNTFNFPFQNPDLPLNERVNDLVSRLTLDEKISQMIDEAPAISRLGILKYNWWNEGLHGVARAGIATVFPQAIGLGATWDTTLIYRVADVISTEFRAKHNEFIRNKSYGRYEGLTVWSPNINIFRDPRWGRGQETYGEDPYLTSQIGISFVKGLQGNDPKYFKTIATAKHFAVHSGPESNRHRFDAVISKRDFLETYTPAFEALVREGKVWSVMGAYNRISGIPTCANKFLLQQTLREKWGFQGFVVSDCDAIDDIWKDHKYAINAAEASGMSVIAGCDLNCGNCYSNLKEAVKSGYISEKELDICLKRLFEARFRLGMFDPQDKVSYTKIPISANNTQENRQLALETARKSMVLLKNENDILPLSKNYKRIAVIGPNADNEDVMYGNYNGTSSEIITPLEGIRKKAGKNIDVQYEKGCNWTNILPEMKLIQPEMLSFNGKPGLLGEYFNNLNFEGNPFATRQDSMLNFEWYYKTPFDTLRKNSYSVRWTGKLSVPSNGKYLLRFNADDRYKFYLDNTLVTELKSLNDLPGLLNLDLKKDKLYNIKIEFIVNGGGASLKFEYAHNDKDPIKNAIALAEKSDIVMFFGGISPRLEGEEMKVSVEGFDGGDRTSIKLPAIQENLLKQLHALNKPIILVLLTGSALSVNWEDENIPAILLSWYPGEEGGDAIADVLFGDYNPAGRLNITWYQSEKDLPPFEDYSMEGRTYRYFSGTPLYPFGYGISFSRFEYSNLQVPQFIKTGENVIVNIDVQNIGKIDGDEVVQLYISNKNANTQVPFLALEGFQRINLKQGEKRTLSLLVKARQFSIIDENGDRILNAGDFEISVGGGQPGIARNSISKTLSSITKLTGPAIVLDRWVKQVNE